jgi:hypothetical protein
VLAADPTLQMRPRRSRIVSQQSICQGASGLEQIAVGREIGEAQHRNTALLCAEQLSRTAQTQVVARDFETIRVLVDDLQALARDRRERLLVEKDAVLLAAPRPTRPRS